jgi:DNA topoisomerase-1
MTKKLVIVESPAKAKTIGKILGDDYAVKASMGHVRDLPVKGIGIAFDKDFAPRYEVTPDRVKIVKELQAAAKNCEEFYLAPDPDREGEAIAWHLQSLLAEIAPDAKFHRVTYNEITPRAVREAFANPRDLNMRLVDAQQARRVLDRIVGYKVSPLLWSQIQRNTSAGRVQSVALRLICEREQEIRAFKPETYWLIGAEVRKQVAPLDPFTVRLARIKGEKADIRSVEQADAIRADLETRRLRVRGVAVKEVSRRASPPFITSTLQQAGSSAFNYTPSRTMRIAQELYEGVDLGEGPAGLITYMRTDSVNIAKDAQEACRQFVGEHFGASYVPAKPNVYKSRGSAQEAHEAVRPTDVARTPDSLKGRLGNDEWKLYSLIWQRFVASQMTPARIEQRTAEVETETAEGAIPDYLFRVTASQVVFPGYMAAFGEKKPKARDPEKTEADKPAGPDEEPEVEELPPLQQGERLDLLKWLEERKETQPPNRFSEATLIKALEEDGVGRPSTYAQILATLHVRRYISKEKQKRAILPTPLGERVNTLLVSVLNELFDVTFTAAMEKKLDAIEEGEVSWTDMLHTFYDQFQIWMEKAKGPPADNAHVRRLLDVLGQVKEWAPGVPRGAKGKIKGDVEFVASVDKQLTTGKKAISARQLEALGRRIARYREQIPDAVPVLQELGLGALLDEAPPQPPSAANLRKLALLTALALDPPETRRGRTYNDAAFVASLKQRADGGRELSPAQASALDRLILKYATRIPTFEQEREQLALQPDGAEGAAGGAPDPEVAAIVERLRQIVQWDEPKQKGKRTFDDKAFFESLSTQFAQRGRLSPKQVGALKRMDKRYQARAAGGESAAGAPAAAGADVGSATET